MPVKLNIRGHVIKHLKDWPDLGQREDYSFEIVCMTYCQFPAMEENVHTNPSESN